MQGRIGPTIDFKAPNQESARGSRRVRGEAWSTPGPVRCRPKLPGAVGKLLLHERPDHARGIRALGVAVG
jgi:hypothetical protein